MLKKLFLLAATAAAASSTVHAQALWVPTLSTGDFIYSVVTVHNVSRHGAYLLGREETSPAAGVVYNIATKTKFSIPTSDGEIEYSPMGISKDGNVIVGESAGTNGTTIHGFTCVNGTTTKLGAIGDTDVLAPMDVTDDGIYLLIQYGDNQTHAPCLYNRLTTAVTPLATSGASTVYGMTPDASCVYGFTVIASAAHAAYWLKSENYNTVHTLPFLYQEDTGAVIYNCTPDASIFVGYTQALSGPHQGRHIAHWRVSGTTVIPTDLVFPAGFSGPSDLAYANSISSDGFEVVGKYTPQGADFIWTSKSGMFDLYNLLKSHGAKETVYDSSCLSSDGGVVGGLSQTLIGSVEHEVGYYSYLPFPFVANHAYVAGEGTQLSVASGQGLLLSGKNLSGTTPIVFTQPTHGQVVLNPNGSFTYSPTAGYLGSDTFKYRSSSSMFPSNIGTVSITVLPVYLTGFSTSPGSVVGDQLVKASLTLAASNPGGIVTFSSSNTQAISTPANLTLAKGVTAASANFLTLPVKTQASVVITATLDGVQRTGTILVNPPALASVATYSSSAVGGNAIVGQLRLTGFAPAGGQVVTLSSSSASAQVPASVTIPGGSSAFNFVINTSGVAAATPVTVTGTVAGIGSTVSFSVQPAALLAVTPSIASIHGGSSMSFAVTLNGAAPPAGATLTLSSSSDSVPIASSVKVASGLRAAVIGVTTKAVSSSTPVTVTVTYAGVSKTANVTVTN